MIPLKTISVIFAFIFLSTSAFAMSIGYRIENDSVSLPDGTTLNADNREAEGRNVTVYGGTVVNLASLENSLSEFNSASSALDRLNAFTSFVNDASNFTHFQEIAVSPKIGVSVDFDWIQQIDELIPDHLPFLLVSTVPIEELELASFIGLVTANITVAPVGSSNVGFTTGTGSARWDNALIGDLNSLTLAAIPEPRVYAVLFGVFALGFVLWRRRRA